MSWVFQIFFSINIRVAKEVFSFRLTKFHIQFNFFITSANSHTFTATTCSCFQNNWVANFICKVLNFFNSFNNSCPRSNRNIVFNHCFTSSSFISHFSHSFCGRSDEFYTLFFANFRKISSFRHKPIPRVNSISTRYHCSRHNCRNAQITIRTFCRSNTISFCCQSHVQRICICLRINCNSRNAQLTASSDNSNCNFASICY